MPVKAAHVIGRIQFYAVGTVQLEYIHNDLMLVIADRLDDFGFLK